MRKKEIIMICFVLLVTAIALFAILQSSTNSSNNSAGNTSSEIKSNTSSKEEASNSNGPTVIEQKNSENKDSATNSTSNNSTSNNTNDDIEEKDDEDNSNSKSSDEKYITYKVKKGETLSTIVKIYEDKCPSSVLSKAILETNNLSKSTDIKEGLEIKIPEKYTIGSKYTVKAGDSLYSVVLSKFEDSDIYSVIKQVKKDNFLSTDNIKIGDQLFISSSIDTNSTVSNNYEDESTQTNTAPISDKELVTYKVKDGETLLSIAKRYEKYCPTTVSTKVILKINDITDAKDIKAGVEIKLPEKFLTNGEKYTVKQGDSLSAIASNFYKDLAISKAIDKIMSDNFINSHNIKMGDQLYITTISLNLGEE